MHHDDQARQDRDQQERPNRETNMEPAEGSRENTEMTGTQGGRGTATESDSEASHREERPERGSELPPESFGEEGAGISNRPLDEEQTRQENVPPRGERRENWKDD